MFEHHKKTSQTEHKAATPSHDTVELTAEELRSISGGSGISLNLEVERDADKKGRSPHHRTYEVRR